MIKRWTFSRLFGFALVLLPWVGCSRSHEFGKGPAATTAGGNAGGATDGVAGAGQEAGAGVAPGEEDCKLTLCGGACTDTTQDAEHCGACDQSCTALPHLGTTDGVSCVGSACQVPPTACADGYAHCSANPADGCETNIGAPEHCGGCDTTCDADAPFCALGKCSVTCPTEAPTECGKACADLMNDPLHCGDCATACASPKGGKASCSGGKCATECLGGFHPCAGATDCASDTDANKCEASCKVCAVPNGTPACVANVCVAQACSKDFHQCPDSSCASNGDTTKCTSACTACPQVPNAEAPTCESNACVTKCKIGFKPCNGKCVDTAVDNSCGGQALSTGNGVACAIKTGGTVSCWSATTLSSPTPVVNLSSVVQLSVYEEACALKMDGTVWCWSLVAPVTPPTEVSAGMKFKQISVSANPACRYAGVASTDKVYCWDGSKWAPKGTFLATHVSLDPDSPYDAYARGTDGAIWQWLSGAAPSKLQSSGYAEVSTNHDYGYGDAVVRRTSAGGVSENLMVVDVGELAGSTAFTQVSAGVIGGCALDTVGKVGCWGYGPFGQLGNGTLPQSVYAMVQFGGSAFRASVVSRGPFWTCAIKTDGTVWCAGKDVPSGNGMLKQVNLVVP